MAAAIAPRIRRSQEQRSEETRTLLLDATINCIIERGYANTTTKEIADRAGVTRGAQLHHFGSKEQLVLAAVERLFELRMRELAEALLNASKPEDENAIALDMTWKIIKSPFFMAYIELLVASRIDETLRRRLQEVGARFDNQLEEIRQRFSDSSQAVYLLVQEFVVCLLAGRVLMSLANDDKLERWVPERNLLGLIGEVHLFLTTTPGLLEKYTTGIKA
jgi:AcrR family transcriptional regulator